MGRGMFRQRPVISPFQGESISFTNEIGTMSRSTRGVNFGVLSYKQMLPLLVSELALYKQALYLISGIIAIALIFGIVDTMLMVVMERTHEFGVSLTIGMSSGGSWT